jgi:hypothetical protein
MRILVVLLLLGVADASVLSKLLEWRGKLLGYPAWAPSDGGAPAKRDAYKPPKASCGAYNREMAVDCFHYLADKNCDHALDRAEVRKASWPPARRLYEFHFCKKHTFFQGGCGQGQHVDVV